MVSGPDPIEGPGRTPPTGTRARRTPGRNDEGPSEQRAYIRRRSRLGRPQQALDARLQTPSVGSSTLAYDAQMNVSLRPLEDRDLDTSISK